MYKEKRIVAIIPARKGSKGIPNKNIREIVGKPLIAYTLIPALKSKYLDQVLISTDSYEIRDIAIQYGAINNGIRPDVLSGDTAILYDVVKYELTNAQKFGQMYDIIILLQPTSPLRTVEMIDEAIEKFIDEKQSSAVGVCKVEENPIFMRTVGRNGKLINLLNIPSTIRRQELPTYYKVNGMIYINWVCDILSNYVSLNDNEYAIIIDKKYSIDVDNLSDLEKVTAIIKNNE